MRRLVVALVVPLVVSGVAIVGCSSAPAAAPAAAPKAAEPTKAPAAQPAVAQPTAVPAPKVNYPAKDKSITLLVTSTAGGPTDTDARILAPVLEKELGGSVVVVNKPGAGNMIGLTEFAQAKPDGYTIVIANLPGIITLMLDPARQATFTRKTFQPIGMLLVDPGAVAVAANGPYKSIKDLTDAAKANPGKVRGGTTGLLGDDHLAILAIQRAAGAKFAVVHFDGSSQRDPALLGGKIDFSVGNVGSFYNMVRQGDLKFVSVLDKQGSPLAPDVPTAETLGMKIYSTKATGIYAPGGTPPEIVDALSVAMKKATANPDLQKKESDQGRFVRYMDPTEMAKYWDEVETDVTPLMKQALEENK